MPHPSSRPACCPFSSSRPWRSRCCGPNSENAARRSRESSDALTTGVRVRGARHPPGYPSRPPMAQLTTSVEHLDDNKVRLKVAVPAAEFEEALEAAFRKLAAD